MNDPLLRQVERILSQDRHWAAYALADLQPDFVADCQWHVGSSAEGEAVVLLYHGLTPAILFTMGPTRAVEAALAQANLPDQIYLNIRNEHLPLLTARYDFSDEFDLMWRMVLSDFTAQLCSSHPQMRTAQPQTASASGDAEYTSVVRLSTQDVERIEALYRHGGPFTPGAFSAYQIDNGCFFGVEAADGSLVAVGGTHIVDWQAGIAAIGNMYTRPDQRGKGYARAILKALVQTLQQAHVTTIVLNVDQRNVGARALYEKLGFQVHTPFVEGVGFKRSTVELLATVGA